MSNESEQNGSRTEIRFFALKIFLILIFIIYSARLFSIQILSGEEYKTRAQNISRRTMTIPAQRGEIYDRNFDRPLAFNQDSFAINIIPGEVPSGRMREVISIVSGIINVREDEIHSKIPPRYYQLFQPIEIAVNVPFPVIASLAERKETLPGVSWNSKPIRNYGDARSLSHILGYVGDITRDELTTLFNLGYQQGDIIGKDGIERQYDELLRGKSGWETRTVDVRGRVMSRDNITREIPEMGKNLVLTIDKDIQLLAEKSLGERIGSVVVKRPATGEILAMVSYPWYDPNVFTSGSRSEYLAMVNDPNKPFINRSIQASYPPASSFKIVMTTGILAENAFPKEQLNLCQGEISYGGLQWRCHVRRPGHGRLNLSGALAQSCNIYYWNICRDYLGLENIVNYSREYGFGEISGIDLPGEIAGLVPTPHWKERRFHERWQNGDTMNTSIGQGFLGVTPIQMANMVSMIVNNGKLYRPHILKEIRDPVTGAIEKSVRPELIKQSSISPSVFENVRRDMRGVITEGTARYPLNMVSAQIAGKTGTGEVGLSDRWHSWFVAYAPYNTENNHEQIVVSVIVEAANRWEWWASYASAIIFQGYFGNQTYEEAIRTLGFQHLRTVEGRRE